MNVTFDTTQLHGLSASFGQAGARTMSLANRAVRKTATDVVSGAKARAPVDTGFLRNSIGMSMTGQAQAEIGPTAMYGVFLEYGTSKMAPRPYLAPALEAAAPGFMAAMEAVGAEALG